MRVQAPPPIIMEIIEIEQKKMEAIKTLSDLSMKISKAQESLIKIEGEKDSYFAVREKELAEKLSTLLQDSQGILNQTYSNYEEIQAFCSKVEGFALVVSKLLEDLTQAQDLFEEREEEFKNVLKIEEERISAIKNELKIKEIHLENEKVGLIHREKELTKQETKAKDLLEELKRGITRLKEGRI